jgi:hypothetical protein
MSDGSLRGGRYVRLGALGEGAQGATFDGVDKREGQPVAIKRFDVRGARTWKDVELAEREARVLSSLDHPALPRYVEHFEEDGALYLVMEKIDGDDLARLRRRGILFDDAEAIRFLRAAAEVLEYLHGRTPPVIHRDLKPGNVIRRPDGRFAFVDFGAVRDKLRLEGGSTVVGTFGYMAPEQFQGRARPASDVYAIGATTLSMMTGIEPEDLPHKGLGIDVERALAGRDRGLIAILSRMLEPDPDVRPASISPLLASFARRTSRARKTEADFDDVVDRFAEEWAKKGEEFAEQWGRAADRAAEEWETEGRRERRSKRRARRRDQRMHARRVPWLPALFATLGLTIATFTVGIALQIVVPLLLAFLSLFFGPGLRRAARAVEEAGRRATAAMGRARGRIRGHAPPREEEAPVRVATEDPRVRVRVAPVGPESALEPEREPEEEASTAAKRRP